MLIIHSNMIFMTTTCGWVWKQPWCVKHGAAELVGRNCSTEVLSFAHLGRNWKYPAIWFAVYLGYPRVMCWFIPENYCDEGGEVETAALLIHSIIFHSSRVPRCLEDHITIRYHKSIIVYIHIYKNYKMGSWRLFGRSRGRKKMVLGILFCNMLSDLRSASILPFFWYFMQFDPGAGWTMD